MENYYLINDVMLIFKKNFMLDNKFHFIIKVNLFLYIFIILNFVYFIIFILLFPS
jgi:hypothetical protein